MRRSLCKRKTNGPIKIRHVDLDQRTLKRTKIKDLKNKTKKQKRNILKGKKRDLEKETIKMGTL